MAESQIVEIVVQAGPGATVQGVAQQLVRDLTLGDGVRVVVHPHASSRRPRRFAVYGGDLVSPRVYAAAQLTAAVEAVLSQAREPLDAWGIVQVARAQGSPLGTTPMATIALAASLLVRQKRLRPGPGRGTWIAATPAEQRRLAG